MGKSQTEAMTHRIVLLEKAFEQLNGIVGRVVQLAKRNDHSLGTVLADVKLARRSLDRMERYLKEAAGE